ncbi:hypothetical protein BJX66DRAFT_313457 [Aspergillus keveii]|uniref:Uncharacterized protein n=1 Tax=Aspergillus keveii TaxID=714993 RepID=A0ABR4FSA4_9EURO
MPDSEDAPFDRNLGLYSALAAVKPTSTESPVSILWTNICGEYFHPDAGFKTVVSRITPQDTTLPHPIVRRIQVIRVTLVGPLEFEESPALHIECRGPLHDTSDDWTSAADQLKDYCGNDANIFE